MVRAIWGEPATPQSACPTVTAGLRCSSPPVDSETWDRIGSLPRTHGLLGALLKEPEVIRRADIRASATTLKRIRTSGHFSGSRSWSAARWSLRSTWRRRSAGTPLPRPTAPGGDPRRACRAGGGQRAAPGAASRVVHRGRAHPDRPRPARLGDPNPVQAHPCRGVRGKPWQVPAPRRMPTWTGCGSCRGPRWPS